MLYLDCTKHCRNCTEKADCEEYLDKLKDMEFVKSELDRLQKELWGLSESCEDFKPINYKIEGRQ